MDGVGCQVLTLCAMKASGTSPPPLAGHTLVHVPPTKVMVFGGVHDSALSGDTYLCDITSGKWELAKTTGFSTPPPLFGGLSSLPSLPDSCGHSFYACTCSLLSPTPKQVTRRVLPPTLRCLCSAV